MVEENESQHESLRQKIHELQIEHRDLDEVISRLSDTTVDQLQLRRLKKRKLHLKDHIAMLEKQITPNIFA